MPERGGPATQSGILYQNSVVALYLGRLCDATPRPDRDRIVGVRVEAPAAVNDTVVNFADSSVTYIQAKENIRDDGEAWAGLWSDFKVQFNRPDFNRGRDRLLLHTGEPHNGIIPGHNYLQESFRIIMRRQLLPSNEKNRVDEPLAKLTELKQPNLDLNRIYPLFISQSE
jgi:hypothetical protein